MRVYEEGNNIVIKGLKDFELGQTMECGQCFHFVRFAENDYGLVAFGKMLHAKQVGSTLTLFDITRKEFDSVWRGYFDLDKNYAQIKEHLLKEDEKLKEAIETMWGVRILRQEFFETLISFIISQNKQIPHIKQIVAAISRRYGTFLGRINDEEFYAFPTAEQMANVTEEQLRACKTGFRAPYIKAAVEASVSGVFDEVWLRKAELEVCRNTLMQIKGVGMKVANCVMLFGLERHEAFPVDVWIKRIMEWLYFEGEETAKEKIECFAAEKFGEYGGYAQQYLFYYGKTIKVGTKK